MSDANTSSGQDAAAKSAENSGKIPEILNRLQDIEKAVLDWKAAPHSGASSLYRVAKRNDVSLRTIYVEIKRGRLRRVKCGNRSLVTPKDEAAWLRRLEEDTAAAEAQEVSE